MSIFNKDKDPLKMGMDLPDGELTFDDLKALQKYATGKELVVELGTFKGRTASFCSYFAKKVVTVDDFPKNKPANFEQVVNDLKRFPNINVIRDLSNLSARHFLDNTIDLLIQDAGHSAENIIDDVKAFLPKIKTGGIIMVHDYKLMNGKYEDRNVQGGVKKLLEQNLIEEVEQLGWYFIARIIK